MTDVLASESLVDAWSFPPVPLVVAAVAVAFFLHGWRRLHARRAGLAPWSRIPLFLAGVLVMLLAIVSPLDPIGERYLQSAHMLQHVVVADLGVVLVLLAVRGPLAFFMLPRPLLAPLARLLVLRRLARFLLRPAVAYAVWVAVLAGWHVPALYEAALHARLWHDLQHGTFLLAGILVWTQIVGLSRHGLTPSERLGYTALVFWTGQLLAYAILFSFTPLYPTYEAEQVRLLGLSPLMDQKIAGLVMMLEQTATLGTAFVVLVLASRRAQREGARAAPHGSPAPSGSR